MATNTNSSCTNKTYTVKKKAEKKAPVTKKERPVKKKTPEVKSSKKYGV